MRVGYPSGRHTSETGDTFLRASGRAEFTGIAESSVFGWHMHRDGSVIGLSATVNISAFSSSGTLTMRVLKNDLSNVIFSATSPTITGTGVVSWGSVQDAGVDTIVAGDILLVEIVVDSGSFTRTHTFSILEVEHDEP